MSLGPRRTPPPPPLRQHENLRRSLSCASNSILPTSKPFRTLGLRRQHDVAPSLLPHFVELQASRIAPPPPPASLPPRLRCSSIPITMCAQMHNTLQSLHNGSSGAGARRCSIPCIPCIGSVGAGAADARSFAVLASASLALVLADA